MLRESGVAVAKAALLWSLQRGSLQQQGRVRQVGQDEAGGDTGSISSADRDMFYLSCVFVSLCLASGERSP